MGVLVLARWIDGSMGGCTTSAHVPHGHEGTRAVTLLACTTWDMAHGTRRAHGQKRGAACMEGVGMSHNERRMNIEY